ncbi:heme peroxidase [Obelidium mucronatum]|nr:heme peroxidase [Obelidium mucronatum]
MNPVVLLISILIAQVSSYKILTQQQAQGATNRLWDEIKVKGGCLFSDKLANAPSKNLAALWLRAVFHDSGSFNATSKTGGLDGSLALDSELSLTENGGIAGSLAHLSLPANSIVTKADAIALGGIVTVATCGGPKVNFTTGRVDATVANIAKDFPSDSFAPVSTMAAAFQRMGLSKLDMMTLVTGSHSMGGAHKAISPALTNETFAPFDSTPGVFDNDIFKKVLAGKCIVPLDCAFAADSTLLPYIKQFSTDQDAFFAQYAISFQKMLSLTASTLSAPVPVNITVHVNLIPEGTFPTTTLIRPTSPPATPKSTAAASRSSPPDIRSPAPAPNSKSSPPPPRPTQPSPSRTQDQPPRPSNNNSARTTRNDQPTRTSSRR